MTIRFSQEQIPGGLTETFTAELQGRLNYIYNALNTLSDEAALDRLLKEGVGRIEGQGGTLVNASGTLRVLDGWFQAGAGVASTEDEYFVGARMAEIKGAGGVGYIEIVADDAPPPNKTSGTFGYMSWYGDVVWFDTKPTTPTQIAALNGRWCIGKVTTDAAGLVTAVDSDVADVVYRTTSLGELWAIVNEWLQNGGTGGGGTGGPVFWELLKHSVTDDTTIEEAFAGADSVLEARLTRLIEGRGEREMRSDLDEHRVEAAITRQNAGLVSPVGLLRSRSANILRTTHGMYGTGQNDTPNHLGPCTVPLHQDTGQFGL